MYIRWKITDKIEKISAEEFDKEYNGVYGFIELRLNDYCIGDFDESEFSEEGYSDILYYISSLIECGISVLKHKSNKVSLLGMNLIEIQTSVEELVNIRIVHTEKRIIECESFISVEELINEIRCNYDYFIDYIVKHNKSLLKTKLLKNFTLLYSGFNKMLIS